MLMRLKVMTNTGKMKMKENKEFMLMKALNFKFQGSNSLGSVLEYMEATGQLEDADVKFQLKNVCAKLPNWLVEELEEVCSVLSMSKRDFIENAIIDSIESFNAIAEEHDIFAPHTPNSFTEEK